MSYDLLVFEPKDAPRERAEFLDWYRVQTQWSAGHTYNDPSQVTGNLSAWYADMQREFPDINAPDADEVTDGEDNPRVTGYSIGRSVIYADFPWSEAESAYAAVRSLAVKHGVGFFNVSGKAGEIWFPPTEDTPDTTAIPGLVLSLEEQRTFKAPSIAFIEAAWIGFSLLVDQDSFSWKRQTTRVLRRQVEGKTHALSSGESIRTGVSGTGSRGSREPILKRALKSLGTARISQLRQTNSFQTRM